tara:strand:- start:227 stop:844 length:618 start_codon:yes stop_codon:yes gene_type:complete
MLAFATSTGSQRNLAALRKHGWGVLLTPDNPNPHDFELFAIDNGAWSCHQRGTEWLPQRWLRLVEKKGSAAQWAALPDVVCGGLDSLILSLSWLPQVQNLCSKWLIVVQDDMTATDLEPHVSKQVGIFVGGSTSWKESSLPMWGRLSARSGCWLHVGRVNTARRIRLCALAGADSFDGTSASKFSITTRPLSMARDQLAMPLDLL